MISNDEFYSSYSIVICKLKNVSRAADAVSPEMMFEVLAYRVGTYNYVYWILFFPFFINLLGNSVI